MALDLQTAVKRATYEQTEFLSGQKHPDLLKLLQQAQNDRRVRNVTPLYALLFQPNEFHTLVGTNRYAAMLNLQLKKALYRLEHSNSEASALAKRYRKQFYPGGKMFLLRENNDVSEEMAKMLQSLVRSVQLKVSRTKEDETYLENKMRKVNLQSLL